VVVRVSRAAAAVGAGKAARAIPDLDYVDAKLGDGKVAEMLRWPHATTEHVVRAYRLITAGLRASARRELGQREGEAQAIEARLSILGERFDESARVEVEKEQMLAEAQLAINASERRDPGLAGTWLSRALAHADDLRARAHGVSGKDELDMIWLAAELSVAMGAPLVADLPKRIDAAEVELAARREREPTLRRYQRWFEVYGAMLGAGGASASQRMETGVPR
jgi:hypothetical protein